MSDVKEIKIKTTKRQLLRSKFINTFSKLEAYKTEALSVSSFSGNSVHNRISIISAAFLEDLNKLEQEIEI